MKTLKVSLAALLLTLAVGEAALQHASAAPKATDPTYDWQHFDRDGNPLGDSESGKTVSEAQSDYGCSGDQAVCAVGTNGSDTQSIRYSN